MERVGSLKKTSVEDIKKLCAKYNCTLRLPKLRPKLVVKFPPPREVSLTCTGTGIPQGQQTMAAAIWFRQSGITDRAAKAPVFFVSNGMSPRRTWRDETPEH